MEEILEFLQSAGTYFVATADGDKPRVRPFGTVDIYNGKLGIQTGKVKPVYRQLIENPNIELCAFKDGSWIRVEGEVYPDDSIVTPDTPSSTKVTRLVYKIVISNQKCK